MPPRWRPQIRARRSAALDDLRREHVADHRALFDRVSFADSPPRGQLRRRVPPTDQRIMKLGAADLASCRTVFNTDAIC